MSTPVWFTTGCSTGFGPAQAEAALELERRWRPVVTARDRERVADLAGKQGLALEVTDEAQLTDAAAAQSAFGRNDVLVNNAGHGYLASVEEPTEEEIRAQFEANVVGLFAMTRAVLPAIRERGKDT
jgi:NAD(P)-dependent dehydrogenase (short-subunit alcohol dehydrogenase family)